MIDKAQNITEDYRWAGIRFGDNHWQNSKIFINFIIEYHYLLKQNIFVLFLKCIILKLKGMVLSLSAGEFVHSHATHV